MSNYRYITVVIFDNVLYEMSIPIPLECDVEEAVNSFLESVLKNSDRSEISSETALEVPRFP